MDDPKEKTTEMEDDIKKQDVALPQGDHPDPEKEKPANETGKEEQGEQAKSKKAFSIWWDIAIVICFILVGGMGYLYYEQMKALPESPLEQLEKERREVQHSYDETRMRHMDAKMRELKSRAMLAEATELFDLRNDLETKSKQIEGLQTEMTALRAQMKAYFDLYKQYARGRARKLQFDTITTVNTKKTYLGVTITKVTDDFVRIVHAGGSTKLDPSDLTDALQARLAFGDPLDLAGMEQEQEKEQEQKEAIEEKYHSAPSASRPQSPVRSNTDSLIHGRFDPPSKLPDVRTQPIEPAQAGGGYHQGRDSQGIAPPMVD